MKVRSLANNLFFLRLFHLFALVTASPIFATESFCPTNRFQKEISVIFNATRPPLLMNSIPLINGQSEKIKANFSGVQIPIKAIYFMAMDENQRQLSEAKIIENFNSLPEFKVKVVRSASIPPELIKIQIQDGIAVMMPSDRMLYLQKLGIAPFENLAFKSISENYNKEKASQLEKGALSTVFVNETSGIKTLYLSDYSTRAHVIAGGIKLLIQKAAHDQRIRLSDDSSDRLKRKIRETIEAYTILLHFSKALKLTAIEVSQIHKILENEMEEMKKITSSEESQSPKALNQTE